jgi:hypothetical protein
MLYLKTEVVLDLAEPREHLEDHMFSAVGKRLLLRHGWGRGAGPCFLPKNLDSFVQEVDFDHWVANPSI